MQNKLEMNYPPETFKALFHPNIFATKLGNLFE